MKNYKASFISEQVTAGEYYYLNMIPPGEPAWQYAMRAAAEANHALHQRNRPATAGSILSCLAELPALPPADRTQLPCDHRQEDIYQKMIDKIC